MFTKNDVGPKCVNGVLVELTDLEKQSIVDEWNANLAKQIVPKKVTMRQARRALLNAGLLPAVTTAISTMTGPAGDAARIDWEFSSEVHREWPLVLSLAPLLGLTSEQMDQLFITAATL